MAPPRLELASLWGCSVLALWPFPRQRRCFGGRLAPRGGQLSLPVEVPELRSLRPGHACTPTAGWMLFNVMTDDLTGRELSGFAAQLETARGPINYYMQTKLPSPPSPHLTAPRETWPSS